MSKSTPRLRVAAAKAPKTPASRRSRRTAAAQKEPAESATNRASVYTALRKKAVGKKAKVSTVALATLRPQYFSAIRYRKYSAKKVATRETRTPQKARSPPKAAPRRISIGKRGKKAVLSGALTLYPSQ